MEKSWPIGTESSASRRMAVIEVLSPPDQVARMMKKGECYEKMGISPILIVDPDPLTRGQAGTAGREGVYTRRQRGALRSGRDCQAGGLMMRLG